MNKELSTKVSNVSYDAISINSNDNYSNHQMEESHPFKEYFRIALVHRRLIGATSLILFVLTLIYSYTTTPLYTAEADISISAYAPTVQGTKLEDSIAKQTEKLDYLETQIKMISRLTLADKMLSDPDVGPKIKAYLTRQKGLSGIISAIFGSGKQKISNPDDSDNQGTYKHPIGLLKSYVNMVVVTPIKKTFLVKISVTTSNPELSAEIANTHAKNFIELAKEDKQRTALNNLLFLRGQAEDLATKVASTEQELAQYAEDNAIVAMDQDEDIVVKKMSELNQMLTAATSKRITSESIYNEAKSGGAAAQASEVVNRGLEDLRLRLREAEAEYADLGQKFKPEYPAMQQLKAKIDSIKNNINQQGKLILKTAESQYKSDLAAEEELRRELEIQKSRAFDLSKRSVKYNSIKREFDSVKDLHQSVLRQLKEAQVTAESQINNITLADKAAIPQTFSSPNRLRNILISIILGPVIGFLISLTKEILNNTIETAEEVQKVLRLPSLGVIPAFNAEGLSTQPEALRALAEKTYEKTSLLESNIEIENSETSNSVIPLNKIEDNHPLVTVNAPFSATSEAFRAVRTSILLSSADHPPRVVLITSSRKGEGKTTLSSNLALTISGTVKSAIIIDCDLRRSSVHKMFNIDKDSPGLVEYLTGQAPLSDVIYKSASDKLFVLPAGIKPPNPAELLGSHKMQELIGTLRSTYEFVLIDSPPVLPVTDAVILSKMVDGVIMVVRGQKTENSVAKETRNRILQVGGKILGVILNGVDVKKGQHYYYYRDSYSEYYDDTPREERKSKISRLWS